MDVTALRVGFAIMLAACQFTAPDANPAAGDDTPAIDASPSTPDGTQPTTPDGPGTPTGVAPGGACSCDADCDADAGHAGICVFGVCMSRASADCSAAGSQAECGAGSRCWNLTGFDGSICWPDCAAHACSGTCDGDGSCAPGANDDCDASCGSACSCNATSCGAGNSCVNGECVPDVGAGPGPGPGPTCTNLPARDCTGTTCGQLIAFNPRTTTAYDDYPINGETSANQYRSFLRRDLMMLVAYATSKVACKAAAWTTGNGGPLGLGDMSESNGAIPGTSIGQPGHPAGTHVNGNDIDVGYYQLGTADNRLRPICNHTANGVDQYHCMAEPTSLDLWRHALFLGAVFESTRTRVIGVDGKAGPILISAMNQLCADGWLPAASCNNIVLAYETTNTGQGWFQFHHHHSHISLKATSVIESLVHGDGDYAPRTKSTPKRPAGLHRLRP
jgi:hypothetical protein